MTEKLGIQQRLDCASCELSSRPGGMCGVVASRTVREMVKIGYDVSSDFRPQTETVWARMSTDPRVMEMASEECNLRLLQQESIQKGYGNVIY